MCIVVLAYRLDYEEDICTINTINEVTGVVDNDQLSTHKMSSDMRVNIPA